jgi:hypothetical protein
MIVSLQIGDLVRQVSFDGLFHAFIRQVVHDAVACRALAALQSELLLLIDYRDGSDLWHGRDIEQLPGHPFIDEPDPTCIGAARRRTDRIAPVTAALWDGDRTRMLCAYECP